MKNFFACMLRTFKDSIESIICLLCKHIMALYKLFILVNVFAMQVANHYNVEAMSRCLFLLVTGFFVLSVMSMAGCAQPIPSGACTKKIDAIHASVLNQTMVCLIRQAICTAFKTCSLNIDLFGKLRPPN